MDFGIIPGHPATFMMRNAEKEVKKTFPSFLGPAERTKIIQERLRDFKHTPQQTIKPIFTRRI